MIYFCVWCLVFLFPLLMTWPSHSKSELVADDETMAKESAGERRDDGEGKRHKRYFCVGFAGRRVD
jgi:hypothetical protein